MQQVDLFREPKKRGKKTARSKKNPGGEQPARSRVAHRKRPLHRRRDPVLITLRLLSGIPNLRSERILGMLRRIFADPRRPEFQAVHYSIQSNHLHLIVEADDKPMLSSGLRSLIIRIALRLNALLGRKGRVFADRYHRRDLPTPTEVRVALRYVLQNWKKHGLAPRDIAALDYFSSAIAFDGWAVPAEMLALIPEELIARAGPRAPRTWMLRTGWRLAGPLLMSDAPAQLAA